MKKIFIMVVMILVVFLCLNLFGAWSMTTNRIGSTSAEITIISASSNDATTNFSAGTSVTRHAGWFTYTSGKTPYIYAVTIISNTIGTCGYISIGTITSNSITVRKHSITKKPDYTAIKIFLMKPHSYIK